MEEAKYVHIIGIGGIGTSAVAKWWKDQGATVSGSDMHPSQIIDDLEKHEIKTKIGHFADNVPTDCDLIIYSKAVPDTNVERQIAVERGITELSYPEFLGELAKTKKTIAVSGTNGKSTTTAMVAKILIDAGLDPTVILGSKMVELTDGNLRVGAGDWFVVEACEHMASMLNIVPDIAVVTNIEEDHLDFYKDIDDIRETFAKWIASAKQFVVLNLKDEQSEKLEAKNLRKFDIEKRTSGRGEQSFTVKSPGTSANGAEVKLKIPGEFNAMNSAAAATAAALAGVDSNMIAKALGNFKGIWRRFENVGKWKETDVYSDYAHHPTAIEGTLKAFKEFFPERRLVICFEPHQHSRTHELFDEFVESFDLADVLILSEVYRVTGRTEEEFEGSKELAEAIERRGKIDTVKYAKDLKAAEDELRDLVEPEDIVVIMGAGPIDNLARKLAG
ncbi:MAG: UDP-N-acetylmuramate--L-alanine ligase [Patescibacteria group bacterium]|nr:UDP-N-acetylmuramate--L-alanine ligase [Patescibacteria group bacterium]